MKRYILTLVTVLASFISINAMSYEEAREEALYLTDKMAYELNLNEEQYEYAYEINLDYLMGLRTSDDIYGAYLSYRNADLRAILYDWQWTLFTATDYFYHPVYWRNGGWYYPIYNYYHHNHFYFDCPSFYYHYHGGHGHYYYSNGFYANRRPSWHGGYRGNDRGHFGGIRDSHRSLGDYRGGGRHNNFGGVSASRGGNTNMGTRGSGRSDYGNRPSMGNRPGMGNRSDYQGRGNRGEGMGNRGENRGSMNSSTRRTMGDDVYGRSSNTGSHEYNRDRHNSNPGGSYSTPSTTRGNNYGTPSTTTRGNNYGTPSTTTRGNYSTPSTSSSRGSYSTPSTPSSRGSYSGSSSSRGSMGGSSSSTRSSSSSSFGGGSSRGGSMGGGMSSGSRGGHSGRGGR